MSIASSLRSLLGGRGLVRRVYVDSTNDGETIVEGMDAARLYATQPHLRTVVDFLARNVAQLSLKCFVRESDDNRQRDTDSPLAMLLANPNPNQTRYDLIFATVAELCLYDRFIWAVVRDPDSDSGFQIRLIPHDWVTNWEGGDGWGYEFVTFSNDEAPGAPVRLPTATCVIGHGYAPGAPAAGQSPIETLKTTLAEQIEAQKFRTRAWKRGMKMTGYVSRPIDAGEWSPEKRTRFIDQMRENWTGNGPHAGGTPVLEDGMKYESVEVSTREKDWSQGVKLSREDVAGAFHVNPAVVWRNDGQTYASAKDNARALYAETLGPLLVQLSERINKDLLRIVGADPREYVEFDIQTKMAGSFEDQASALQTSVGAAWLTRNEARARLNLPAIEGADELIVPLNVTEGGQASPTDSAPTQASAAHVDVKGCGCGCEACRKSGEEPPRLRHKAAPTEAEAGDYEAAFRSFFERQRRSVLAAMGASKSRGTKAEGDDAPDWWDGERWDSELAADLRDVTLASSEAEAVRTLAELGIDPDSYDPARATAFLEAVLADRAAAVNAVTLDQLRRAEGGEGGDGEKSTPAGVFDEAEASRAARLAATLATSIAAWSSVEAARQTSSSATKTWITGSNPRQTHAAMNGDTVPVGSNFSNGADWPGDTSALDVADIANCNCTVEIRIP